MLRNNLAHLYDVIYCFARPDLPLSEFFCAGFVILPYKAVDKSSQDGKIKNKDGRKGPLFVTSK